jgi:Cof subfamily protein (haloacid dehalogenase superfamily)
MEKKILFTDLDGTLLKDNKSISAEDKKAIERMLAQGHYFAVTTGRPKVSALAAMKELSSICNTGCYLVCYNGALILEYATKQSLAERTVSIEWVSYLFEEAEKYGLYAHTYHKDRVVTPKYTSELAFYVAGTGMSYRLCDSVIGELDTEPNKILIISVDDPRALVRFQEEHKNWEKGKCSSFFSCNEYLEYCPAATDKGTGVKFLSEFLTLNPNNTVAVGDERNDIPMIQAAAVGVAMKNGNEAVKWAADDVTTPDNNHSAIAWVINKYILC